MFAPALCGNVVKAVGRSRSRSKPLPNPFVARSRVPSPVARGLGRGRPLSPSAHAPRAYRSPRKSNARLSSVWLDEPARLRPAAFLLSLPFSGPGVASPSRSSSASSASQPYPGTVLRLFLSRFFVSEARTLLPDRAPHGASSGATAKPLMSPRAGSRARPRCFLTAKAQQDRQSPADKNTPWLC